GAGIQMLCGGFLMLGTSGLLGEFATFEPAAVTRKSFLAFLYLLVLGSLLALTVYNWMLHVSKPTLVSTHVFVNPVIAVLLGWLLAVETLTGTALAAGAVIVAAVAWLIWTQWREAKPAPATTTAPTPHPMLNPLPNLCGGQTVNRELQ